MAQKKSIDEIWRELNARPKPRSSSVQSSKPGATSTAAAAAAARTSTLGAQPSSHAKQPTLTQAISDEMNSPEVGARKGNASYDPAKAGLPAEEVAAYLASMQRLVNCLGDQDRATRRQAAMTLQTKLMRGDAATPAASPAMLQALVCGPLLYPLVGMLADTVEKCR
jgi:hypothetical protein